MDTQLLIVILSILGLHLAALVGGGVALGIMRLLGHKPPELGQGDASESIH